MAENFDLIFGSSASQSYSWNDSDYQNGWQTVGDTPPTREQFNALQRRADLKAQELNNALTPLVTANNKNNRKPSTTYAKDDIQYSDDLPTGWFLECTVAGTTSAGALVVPSPVHVNDTITDGTVTWTVKKTGSGNGDGAAVGDIKAIAYNGAVQAGWLLCDGSAVSRTMFPDLFTAIGTTYGAGDGSTTFNLPDYNAAKRFAQGDTVAGVVKQAGLPNITADFSNEFNLISESTVASTLNGAIQFTKDSEGAQLTSGSTTNRGSGYFEDFDASRSSAIYGNSTTVQPNALTARYIIKAFDGQTASSALIDVTQYANELANKADRKLSNLDTANLACHVVVDSHYDNTTGDWWRKYDDGWIEQGGIIQSSVVNGNKTVNLLKPYSNTNYVVQLSYNKSDAGTTSGISACANLKTTTTFALGSQGGAYAWVAFGQGAQS